MVSSYALIYLMANALPAIVGFFALILYTHLLSPAEYGVYVIGASIAGIVSAFFFAWVRLSVSRYQAGSPELDFRGEAALGFGGSVAVIACLVPVVLLTGHSGLGVGMLAGSLFLSLSINAFSITQEFQRARFKPLRFMAIAVFRAVLGLALGYAAVALGGGGLGLLVALGASFLIANVFSFPRIDGKPFRLFPAERFTLFVRYGLPFSLGAVTFVLQGAVDRLGIAYLLGTGAAGSYGLAADMTRQLVVLLASSVASAMFPMAFRSFTESGAAAARERLNEGFELLLALIVPTTIWLSIAANAIAGTLLGSEFQMTVAALLPILAIGRMCGSVNQYYVQVSFQLAEKPLLQVLHDFAILAASVVLLVPLTLAYGLVGAAAAVMIAEMFGILFGVWLSRGAFRLPFNWRGTGRVAAATVVMASVSAAARAGFGEHGVAALLGIAASGGVAYAGAAILFDVAGVRRLIGAFFNSASDGEGMQVVRLARGEPAPAPLRRPSMGRNP